MKIEINDDIERINVIESKIKYKFKNKDLILNAITHKSYGYEKNVAYNERLEFLGDSILGFVIAEKLYISNEIDEGHMSKRRAFIVCEDSLYEIAKYMELDKILRYGGGIKNVPPKAVLADAIESIIAAIYLDSNIENTKRIILTLFKNKINESNKSEMIKDHKTALQEFLQKYNPNSKLEYINVREKGPDHKKVFEVWLMLNNKHVATGIGKNKKEAETEAAKMALNSIKNKTKELNLEDNNV